MSSLVGYDLIYLVWLNISFVIFIRYACFVDYLIFDEVIVFFIWIRRGNCLGENCFNMYKIVVGIVSSLFFSVVVREVDVD